MINFLPHLVAAAMLLTTQLAFANEYRELQNHSYQLIGQVKDLRWLAEDVMVNHPERRSVLREIDQLRDVARDLDDAVYDQERLGKILDELNHVQSDLQDLREKLTSRRAAIGRFNSNHGPSIAVGGCMPGQDPVAFLLNKTYELDATTACMEQILGVDQRHRHSHANTNGPSFPLYEQAPTPVPYNVLPPKFNQPKNPVLPPPLPPQSWNNHVQPSKFNSPNQQPVTTIKLGGVRLTFAP